MENKINIAELLKDCPEGMELDCTIFDNVVFERVDFSLPNYPIVLKRMKDGISFFVTKYGQCCDSEDCKCAIFPKGKNTWEEFVPPCKFKVGDKIVHKQEGNPFTITEITDGCYKGGTRYAILITQQDNFELVPNKFDITTLIPFESRVLVREDKTDVWRPTFYGFFHQHSKRFYTTSSGTWLMCIPYNEDTKLLTGNTRDCDDFYKTWEE